MYDRASTVLKEPAPWTPSASSDGFSRHNSARTAYGSGFPGAEAMAPARWCTAAEELPPQCAITRARPTPAATA